jgi:hypothetical protein
MNNTPIPLNTKELGRRQLVLEQIDKAEKEQLASQQMSWQDVAWYAQQEVERIHNAKNPPLTE